MLYTKKAYTTEFKHYGKITVPKGVAVTHKTAMGVDENYHFVDAFGWIETAYPDIANTLTMDMKTYGLNVPKEYIAEQLYKVVWLGRVSMRRKILRRGLTRAEAIRVVNSYPDRNNSIVMFMKQSPFLER